MNETVKIFALGGMDENGKSLYVVDYNSQLYVFDAGLRYPEESLLGVDVILPGFQYLIAHKDRIRGFFLTHGHDENMGALPFILEEIGKVDVYGTNFTLLSLYQTADRFSKDIRKATFHQISGNQSFVVNGMKIHAFSVTHSVPNACGYALETENGMIVYPGDFILDFSCKPPYDTNLNRIMEIAKKPTLALLAESYNSSYRGFVAPNNHLQLNTIMDEVKGRIRAHHHRNSLVGLCGMASAGFRQRIHARHLSFGDGAHHCLSVCFGTCHTHRHHGRYRQGSRVGNPHQECRESGSGQTGECRGARQDGYAHRRTSASDRCRLDGRRSAGKTHPL